MAINEILQMCGHLGQLQVTASLDLACDVLRYVLRPPLRRVEGGHPDRVCILAGPQVLNDRLEVRSLEIRLPPGATYPAEVVCEVNRLVISRDNRRRPIRFTHKQLHAAEPGFKRPQHDSFPAQ